MANKIGKATIIIDVDLPASFPAEATASVKWKPSDRLDVEEQSINASVSIADANVTVGQLWTALKAEVSSKFTDDGQSTEEGAI